MSNIMEDNLQNLEARQQGGNNVIANQETSSNGRTMSSRSQVADTDGSYHEGDSSHQHDTNSNDAPENLGDQTPLIDTPAYYGSFFCNPTSMCHKGMALVLMCSMGFGSYFCYDNPGALQVIYFKWAQKKLNGHNL